MLPNRLFYPSGPTAPPPPPFPAPNGLSEKCRPCVLGLFRSPSSSDFDLFTFFFFFLPPPYPRMGSWHFYPRLVVLKARPCSPYPPPLRIFLCSISPPAQNGKQDISPPRPTQPTIRHPPFPRTVLCRFPFPYPLRIVSLFKLCPSSLIAPVDSLLPFFSLHLPLCAFLFEKKNFFSQFPLSWCGNRSREEALNPTPPPPTSPLPPDPLLFSFFPSLKLILKPHAINHFTSLPSSPYNDSLIKVCIPKETTPFAKSGFLRNPPKSQPIFPSIFFLCFLIPQLDKTQT